MWKKAGGRAEEWHEAAAIDEAVSRLPRDLRDTVFDVYLEGGAMADRVRRLGCPETTISRRLGRADRLLIEQLRANAEKASLDAERVEMRNRLDRADRD